MKNILYAIFFVVLSNDLFANEVVVYYPQPVTISQTVVQVTQPVAYQVWVPVNVYYEQRLVQQNQYWITPPNVVLVQPPPVRHRCRLFNY
jgi:hypothetical protein